VTDSRLIERDASVLIVVDAQAGFLAGDGDGGVREIVARMAWLTGIAAALDVPVVVTEEDPDRNGPTEETILAHVPAGSPVLIKPVFGLADTPAIREAVEATARRTAVLVGTETDVCITHSALGLLDRGYRVAVVSDATYSPGAMHEHGLRRIAEAGGTIIHAKGVYYEWLRTVDAATAFRRAHPDLGEPPGFRL
jgi:nicotinamidase-related amidase